jgi:hypothetical protein
MSIIRLWGADRKIEGITMAIGKKDPAKGDSTTRFSQLQLKPAWLNCFVLSPDDLTGVSL